MTIIVLGAVSGALIGYATDRLLPAGTSLVDAIKAGIALYLGIVLVGFLWLVSAGVLGGAA